MVGTQPTYIKAVLMVKAMHSRIPAATIFYNSNLKQEFSTSFFVSASCVCSWHGLTTELKHRIHLFECSRAICSIPTQAFCKKAGEMTNKVEDTATINTPINTQSSACIHTHARVICVCQHTRLYLVSQLHNACNTKANANQSL